MPVIWIVERSKPQKEKKKKPRYFETMKVAKWSQFQTFSLPKVKAKRLDQECEVLSWRSDSSLTLSKRTFRFFHSIIKLSRWPLRNQPV